MTTAEDVLDAICTRLAEIKKANGYRTDAGVNPVFRGRERIDFDQPTPVFSVFLADESLYRDKANAHHRDIKASFLIACWLHLDESDDPIQPMLDVVVDVKKALFDYSNASEITSLVMDHYYEGTSFMPRQDGGTFAQVVVEGVFIWREEV